MKLSRTIPQKVAGLYKRYGEAGVVPEKPGAPERTVTERLCARLLQLVREKYEKYGFHPTRWSSEMLALQIEEDLSVAIHASTARRLLPKLGIVWNRARSTVCIADRQKPREMRAIRRALAAAGPGTPEFYVDEADVDLNPRIGSAWTPRGQQTTIPTPGKNQKRYLGGALHARTGNVLWVEGEKKNRFLSHNPKFRLLFQPVYRPWVNAIERLLKQLHDNVTRNHRCATMTKLMNNVRHFGNNISLFSETHYALLKA